MSNWQDKLKTTKHCKKCNATFGNVPDKWNNKCPICGDELQ